MVHGESRFQYFPQALLSVHTGPLYQYVEVAQVRVSFSVHCTDNKVRTDIFFTDSESEKGVLVICTVLKLLFLNSWFPESVLKISLGYLY